MTHELIFINEHELQKLLILMASNLAANNIGYWLQL